MHHVVTNTFEGKLCTGEPEVCTLLGEQFHSVEHDNYKYAAAGYESTTGTVLSNGLLFQEVKYQRTRGLWYGMCPYVILGAGYTAATLGNCVLNQNNTYNWGISSFGSAFFPSGWRES